MGGIHLYSVTFLKRRSATGADSENGPGGIELRTRNLFDSNFLRIHDQTNFPFRKFFEEDGLNVPYVRFGRAGIFFNVPGYSGLDSLHRDLSWTDFAAGLCQ